MMKLIISLRSLKVLTRQLLLMKLRSVRSIKNLQIYTEQSQILYKKMLLKTGLLKSKIMLRERSAGISIVGFANTNLSAGTLTRKQVVKSISKARSEAKQIVAKYIPKFANGWKAEMVVNEMVNVIISM